MKATVAAVESTCQSSVRSLPRRFGDLEKEVSPLGFSATERKLCMFDGGSELDLLEAVPEHERTDAQTEALQTLDKEEWCRPCLPLRTPTGSVLSASDDTSNTRESVYGKPVSEFAVGQYPSYKRHGAVRQAELVATDGMPGRSNGSDTLPSQPPMSTDPNAAASAEGDSASR